MIRHLLHVDFEPRRGLQEQVRELAPSLRFVERVANPPAFADVDPDRALKVLVFQQCDESCG